MKKTVSTDKAPAAVGAYSQGILCGGLLFTSGQLPINPATGELLTGDIGAQARQSMENIGAILAAEGMGFGDIIKTTIFLANIGDFAAVDQVYKSFFEGSYPARSCFQVAALPKGAGVEIEVVAGK